MSRSKPAASSEYAQLEAKINKKLAEWARDAERQQLPRGPYLTRLVPQVRRLVANILEGAALRGRYRQGPSDGGMRIAAPRASQKAAGGGAEFSTRCRVSSTSGLARENEIALPLEKARLRQAALVYVINLHGELSEENGAPTLGTQNQAVDFILGEPELCRAVAAWGTRTEIDEAAVGPLQRLPEDALYRRVRAYLEKIMDKPVFARPSQLPH